MKNIAIFASGGGSNAQKIIEHFSEPARQEGGKEIAQVSLIISNKSNAGVLEKAAAFGIPTLLIDREKFYKTEDILKELDAYSIDLVVLAGFLWLVPTYLVKAYKNRILNIHPALLPDYGGKGMYGMNVHRAVKAAGEKASGMTIHFVNEHYDEGGIIFQATCHISPNDTPENIAKNVLALEHRYFPEIIEKVLQQ